MYIILDRQEQNQPERYPAWCGLSWFHNCVDIDADVERHYHDLPEIWLWHQGRAHGLVGDEPVPLRPGVMVYTPAGCQHAYTHETRHSNTGITPRAHRPVRRGHLHVVETGEDPVAEMPAFWFAPEDKAPAAPARFPRGAFLHGAYRGLYAAEDPVWNGGRDAWWALLVRQGRLVGHIEGRPHDLVAGQLLITSAATPVDLHAATASDVAFALGRPG